MGEEYSRRRLLGAGLAAMGFTPVAGRNVASTDSLSNTLKIVSDGGGVAAYEFTVSGALRQIDRDDRVTDNRAYGHVGPERGTDTFSFSGELTGFVLAGPATVYRDGYRLRPTGYPAPEGCLAAADFPSRSGTSKLRIESDGGGVAAYEFTVNGTANQVDRDDHVTGRHAYGHVGPKRGADEFEISGTVTRFDLAGPASVYLDGTAVTPSSGDVERSVVRASPPGAVTATPGTMLLFEALARGNVDGFVFGDWYVDGQQWVGPTAFHSQMGGPDRSTFTYSFDEPGTHRVRGELWTRDRSGDDRETLGSVAWTVRVGADGNRPPTVELVDPAHAALEPTGDPPERRTFVATAHDPEGELDWLVWWLSQCDYVVDVSPASGASTTASLSYALDAGCPLGVRAIDQRGAVSELEGWYVEREDR